MKLAIKNNEIVNNLTELQNLDVTTLSVTNLVFVISEMISYMYFENGNYGLNSNTASGKWVEDKFAKPIFAVNDNYDFITNSVTEMNLNTYLDTNLWRLGDYQLTYNDYNQIADGLGWERLVCFIGKDACKAGLVLAPHIITMDSVSVNPNETVTLKITAENIDSKTFVRIPGFDGVINDVRILSAIYLEIDLTIGNSIGNYNIILANGYRKSDEWPVDLGLNQLKVSHILPSGSEKYIKIASASGDNYIGTAFSNSQFNFDFNSDKAFDGNSGTRHYSAENQSQNHIVGIIMSQLTFLTKISFRGDLGSNGFRLEGSNDTTTGLDGTWVDLGIFDLKTKYTKIEEHEFVYFAFRLTWIDPVDSQFANVKEIKLKGRQ